MLLQWILVGGIGLLALLYLLRAFGVLGRRSGGHCPGCDGCGKTKGAAPVEPAR